MPRLRREALFAENGDVPRRSRTRRLTRESQFDNGAASGSSRLLAISSDERRPIGRRGTSIARRQLDCTIPPRQKTGSAPRATNFTTSSAMIGRETDCAAPARAVNLSVAMPLIRRRVANRAAGALVLAMSPQALARGFNASA